MQCYVQGRMSLLPAFHLHLHGAAHSMLQTAQPAQHDWLAPAEKIQRGQATIGKFDGQHPSLACATAAGKVFMHSPHVQVIMEARAVAAGAQESGCH